MNFKLYSITYRFRFPNGSLKEFRVDLESPSMNFHKTAPPDPLPVWTQLSHQKCANCQLSETTHTHCPVAVNMVQVVEAFHDVYSHDESDVEVITPFRMFSARVKNTQAVGSLIGIYMVTSGCPILDKLRPMVFTHLPFATTEESVYRAISMYLMAQYFRYKKGLVPDWDLKELASFYDEVKLVNQSFVKRLTTFVEKDASLNALVLLNSFANATRSMILHERFHEVEPLFGAYFGDPD
ncbi:MAG: hypothetical protein WCS31_10465 [Verrucomicrobiae bacterium]